MRLPRVPDFGLSPRVRGNLTPTGEARSAPRSIPACAGEPHRQRSTPAGRRVYPRVCGGTLIQRRLAPPSDGLSPRVRGNRIAIGQPQRPRGSIPACAGEPVGGVTASPTATVYPRVCGGTLLAPGILMAKLGLSPRVRGNPRPRPRPRRYSGSIPACAGEPTCAMVDSCPSTVYPRVCGGTIRYAATSKHPTGLSPRVRGNPLAAHRTRALMRSIPACAGEPTTGYKPALLTAVYPRVCGGTLIGQRRRRFLPGLSPRVRGNLRSCPDAVHRARSIPACAGEPGTAQRSAGSPAVYPRVCGGTGQQGYNTAILRGLSPRVRGNRRHPAQAQRLRGSIPACAGEP